MVQRFLAIESNFTTQVEGMPSSKSATFISANKFTIFTFTACDKSSHYFKKRITQRTNRNKNHHLPTYFIFSQISKQSAKFVDNKGINQ